MPLINESYDSLPCTSTAPALLDIQYVRYLFQRPGQRVAWTLNILHPS